MIWCDRMEGGIRDEKRDEMEGGMVGEKKEWTEKSCWEDRWVDG